MRRLFPALFTSIAITCAHVCALAAPARAAGRPPMPSDTIDPAACSYQWLEGEGIGVWAQDCTFKTGHWRLRWEKEMRGFALWVDDTRTPMVLQLFPLAEGAAIDTLLPELRRRALIADTDDCVFRPASVRPVASGIAQWDIQPVGAALKAFEATPDDEVPEPPCGDYAWSTHGTRFFQTYAGHPAVAVYFDLGQDGTFFNPDTVTLLP